MPATCATALPCYRRRRPTFRRKFPALKLRSQSRQRKRDDSSASTPERSADRRRRGSYPSVHRAAVEHREVALSDRQAQAPPAPVALERARNNRQSSRQTRVRSDESLPYSCRLSRVRSRFWQVWSGSRSPYITVITQRSARLTILLPLRLCGLAGNKFRSISGRGAKAQRGVLPGLIFPTAMP